MFARRSIQRYFALGGPQTVNTLASQERVVSTPTWPVPYQNRQFRAFPTRYEENQFILTGNEIGLAFWLKTKNSLERTEEGRKVVEGLENLPIKSYIIARSDVGAMAKSYVADMVGFIDIANKENTRILASSTLI